MSIMFPEGTEISVCGQPILKPWGEVFPERLQAKTLKPHTIEEMITSLVALWDAHNASRISLSGPHFYARFSPERGFFAPANGEEHTFTAAGLSELLRPL